MRLLRQSQQTVVMALVHLAGEYLGVDPVATLGKQPDAIDLQSGGGILAGLGKTHRLLPATLVHHHPHAAEAHVAAYAVLRLSHL